VVVFAATLSATLPSPDPLAPAVTVIQAALLTAVQVQPVGAVTETLLVPPAAVLDALVADSANVHVTPLCVTVTVCPATVIVPVRDVPAGLAATL
jgi:hypothetical protein